MTERLRHIDYTFFPLLLLPWLLILLNRAWIYTAPGIDAWIYYGYFFNFSDYIQFFPEAYFGDRLSWILPGYVLNELFPPLAANLILRLLVYYLAVFSLYGILRGTFGQRAGLLGSVLLGCYLPFLGAVGWNYLDGIGIAYLLLSMYLLTLGANSPRWWVWLFLAGMAYAALVFTNLTLTVFAPFLGGYYLVINRSWRHNPLPVSIALPILGAVILSFILGLVNVWAGGDFLFFLTSVSFALEGSNETGNALAQVAFSELKLAHHLAIVVVAVFGAVVWLFRERMTWREKPLAAFFQIYLIGIFGVFLLLEVTTIHALYLFYYANYLLPAALIALTTQIITFLPLDNLSLRFFAGLLGGTVLLVAGLPLAWGAWRDLSVTSLDGSFPLLVTTLILLVGFLTLLIKRPEMLLIFCLTLGVVGYRTLDRPTVKSNPPTDLEGDDSRFLLAIHAGIRAVQAVGDHQPMYFWLPDSQPYYALASAHVNPDSFFGRPFPQIYNWVDIQAGMQVAILSEGEQPVFETAREVLNERLFDPVLQRTMDIPYGDTSFSMTFIQVEECSRSLDPAYQAYKATLPPTDAVIFYPAQDYAQRWRDFPAEHACLIGEDEAENHYELMAAFELARDESRFDAEAQAAIEAWRTDKSPDQLRAAGIEYLLVNSQWMGWLTPQEIGLFENEALYDLVKRWRFDRLDQVYSLYRIVGEQP
jgi:hypothetical protein